MTTHAPAETTAQLMALRSRIRVLIASSLASPEDEQRVRLHAKAIAVAEYDIMELEQGKAVEAWK